MVYSEPGERFGAKAQRMKLWTMAEGYVMLVAYTPYVIAVLASSWAWDRLRALVGVKPR